MTPNGFSIFLSMFAYTLNFPLFLPNYNSIRLISGLIIVHWRSTNYFNPIFALPSALITINELCIFLSMYSIHYTLYSIHCIVCSVYCTVYTVQCIVYSVYCILYSDSVYCTVYSVYCILCRLLRFSKHKTYPVTGEIVQSQSVDNIGGTMNKLCNFEESGGHVCDKLREFTANILR